MVTTTPGENSVRLGYRLFRTIERVVCFFVGAFVFGGLLLYFYVYEKAKEKTGRIRCGLRNWQPFGWL